MDTNMNDWVPVGKVRAMDSRGNAIELALQAATISGITFYRVNVMLDDAPISGELYHAIANPLHGKSANSIVASNSHYILYTDDTKYYFSI